MKRMSHQTAARRREVIKMTDKTISLVLKTQTMMATKMMLRQERPIQLMQLRFL